MIPRYTLPEMAGLWSDETRFNTWLKVELTACEAQAKLVTGDKRLLDNPPESGGLLTPAEAIKGLG